MTSREMEDIEMGSLLESEIESGLIPRSEGDGISPTNYEALEREILRSGTEILDLEGELIAAQGRVLFAADRSKEYQNEIKSLKAALSRQRADASLALQKIQDVDEIRKNLEFEITQLRLRGADLESQINLEKKNRSEIENILSAEINGRRILAAETAKNAGDLERERSLVSDLRKESARLQEELIGARSRAASLETEIKSERQKRIEIEGGLKGRLDLSAEGQSSLKAAVEKAQSEIARLKQELSAALERNSGVVPSQEAAQKKSDEVLSRAQAEITSLRKELEALKSRAQESSEPQAEIRMQSAPLESLGDDAVAFETVLPIIEPALLEPAWNKILGILRKPVLSAQARLRQLASLSLAEGPRAILKFALSSLAEISDTLKVLGEYLDEAGAPGVLLRAETVIEAAVGPWEPFLRSRRIALVRQFSQPLGTVFVNQEALRTAIYQIVRNAYEAMPRGGVFTVKLELDPSAQEVRAIFSDTGPGFSEAALSQVFMPFATTRLGHLGLGLALTRNILRRYGGDAEAKNAEPKGALVTLRFSSAPAQLPPLEMIN